MRIERRWWALIVVVMAQFMFGLDAFIVNVALPAIGDNLRTTPAELEAVVAIYFIGYGTLVITGGRLGDLYGTKNIFVLGVLGFTLSSLWCGLAGSGTMLVLARFVQGAAGALMIPQVLGTIHLQFGDRHRARAFGIYGMALGLAAASGFLIGGLLLWLDVAGLGWRAIFFVNVPFGIAIAAAAIGVMQNAPSKSGVLLDIPGVLVLFVGLSCIICPLLFGRDLDWDMRVWATMATGFVILVIFAKFELRVAARGGMPLMNMELFQNAVFARGLGATFSFAFGNLSFYLAMTLYAQGVLGMSPLQTGVLFMGPALVFVVAAQHSGIRSVHRGTLVLIEGCLVQMVGLLGLGATFSTMSPGVSPIEIFLVVFAYGQGMVMAPLSSAVLAGIDGRHASVASGIYVTVSQIGNAAGVAAVGAIYFALNATAHHSIKLLASLAVIALATIACASMVAWMRSATSKPDPEPRAGVRDGPTQPVRR
jgi:MFS family permease